MSFLPGPYSNGKWEVIVDGWHFYHDPTTVHLTGSGKELWKYLGGYPGGPDWSFCLPEPFVAVWENRMKDEKLWCEVRHTLETKGWMAVREMIEPTHGWPTRDMMGMEWETCKLIHVRGSGTCKMCQPYRGPVV